MGNKIFDPKMVLSKRNEGTKIEQRLKWTVQFEIYSMGRNQLLTLLLMLCCAFSQESGMASYSLRGSCSSWLRQVQSSIGKHYGRDRGMIEGNREDCNPIGRTIMSPNLDPWKFPWIELPRKEYAKALPRSRTHIYHRTTLSGLSGIYLIL